MGKLISNFVALKVSRGAKTCLKYLVRRIAHVCGVESMPPITSMLERRRCCCNVWTEQSEIKCTAKENAEIEAARRGECRIRIFGRSYISEQMVAAGGQVDTIRAVTKKISVSLTRSWCWNTWQEICFLATRAPGLQLGSQILHAWTKSRRDRLGVVVLKRR